MQHMDYAHTIIEDRLEDAGRRRLARSLTRSANTALVFRLASWVTRGLTRRTLRARSRSAVCPPATACPC